MAIKKSLKGEHMPLAIPIVQNDFGFTKCSTTLRARIPNDYSEEFGLQNLTEPFPE